MKCDNELGCESVRVGVSSISESANLWRVLSNCVRNNKQEPSQTRTQWEKVENAKIFS